MYFVAQLENSCMSPALIIYLTSIKEHRQEGCAEMQAWLAWRVSRDAYVCKQGWRYTFQTNQRGQKEFKLFTYFMNPSRVTVARSMSDNGLVWICDGSQLILINVAHWYAQAQRMCYFNK